MRPSTIVDIDAAGRHRRIRRTAPLSKFEIIDMTPPDLPISAGGYPDPIDGNTAAAVLVKKGAAGSGGVRRRPSGELV